jgi:hypothetical protein
MGGSQGALGPATEGPQASLALDEASLGLDHAVLALDEASLALDEAILAQLGAVGSHPDNDILTAAISFPDADYFVAPRPLLEDAIGLLPAHLAYTPPSAETVADEVWRSAALAIEQFTLKARRIRHNARADLRHIHEAIREIEALAGNPDDILVFEEMKVARWIVDAVRQASMLTGADAIYMMALADKESSLIPHIAARTSSAEGLFQFIEQTWLEVVEKYGAAYGLEAEAEAIAVDKKTGRRSVADAEERERILNLRRDPLIAGIMAGEMMKRDRARIEAELERELTPHEMYMAHFLGAGGATRLLKLAQESPKKVASKEFPAAARANRTLFFAGKGKGTALSVKQVYDRIETMIAPRLERYASLHGTEPPTQMARARTGPLPVRLPPGD